MKIKNVKQKIEVPITFFLGNHGLGGDIKSYDLLRSKSPFQHNSVYYGKDFFEDSEMYESTLAHFFEKITKALDKNPSWAQVNEIFKINSFLDKIDLQVSLGDVVFEIYKFANKAPTAPLKKVLYDKNIEKLTEVCSESEIDTDKLPTDAIGFIKEVISSDEKTFACPVLSFYTEATLSGEPFYHNNFNLGMVSYFSEIEKALVELVG